MVKNWGNDLYYKTNYWPDWFLYLSIILGLIILAIAVHWILRLILRPKREPNVQESRLYLFPAPIRIWHWGNAIIFFILAITGIINHFGIGNTQILSDIHHYFGIFFIVWWVFFLVINVSTGNIIHYKIKIHGFIGRIMMQVKYYLFGIMKAEQPPFEADEECKFNPLQQAPYVLVAYALMPFLMVTGLLALHASMGSLMFMVHAIAGMIGIIFIFVHVYMTLTGNYLLQHIKGMIDGYYRHDES